MSRSLPQQILDVSARQLYRLAHCCLTVFNELLPLAGRGAYVAVWHNDKILLIQNGYKSYNTFPCGNVGSSEGVECAAIRELYEEVGIYAHRAALELNMVLPYNERYDHQIVFMFELYLESLPNIRIDHREVVEAYWCTLSEALSKELCTPVRIYLEGKIKR